MNWVDVLAGAIGIGAAWLTVWYIRKSGRDELLKEQAEKGETVRDEQLKQAVNRPTRDELVDRLRDGFF